MFEPLQQGLRRRDFDRGLRPVRWPRQAIEARADFRHRGVRVGYAEVRLDCLGPGNEEAHRLVLGQGRNRRQVDQIGQGQRCEWVLLLAIDTEGVRLVTKMLTPGRERAESRTTEGASTTRSKLSITRRIAFRQHAGAGSPHLPFGAPSPRR